MLTDRLLLAATELPRLPEAETQTNRSAGLALQDFLLFAGILLTVAVVLFFWIYLTRKKSRRYTEGGAKVIYKADKKDLERHTRRMKRRRRRPNHPDNLPRNPTLAEAGGLPPIRPDEPPEHLR